jgi:hypothetical protein
VDRANEVTCAVLLHLKEKKTVSEASAWPYGCRLPILGVFFVSAYVCAIMHVLSSVEGRCVCIKYGRILGVGTAWRLHDYIKNPVKQPFFIHNGLFQQSFTCVKLAHGVLPSPCGVVMDKDVIESAQSEGGVWLRLLAKDTELQRSEKALARTLSCSGDSLAARQNLETATRTL